MKPAGIILLLPAGLGLMAAAEPAPPKLSARLSEELRLSLPKYAAPPETAAASENPATSDPDVLVLPKMVIQEKRLPGNDPDVWLGERRVQQKAMSAYRDSMTDLEWALNSWFIPLFSAPASVRARAAYASTKVAAETDRLNSLIRIIAVSDPKEAAKMRRAMDPAKLPKDD